MLQLNVTLGGDGAWPDLAGKEIIHIANDAPPIRVATLDHGVSSGLPSVAIRFDLPDGRTVVAETSARLFCSAALAIMARYPTLMQGG